jgi:hypothetical protein
MPLYERRSWRTVVRSLHASAAIAITAIGIVSCNNEQAVAPQRPTAHGRPSDLVATSLGTASIPIPPTNAPNYAPECCYESSGGQPYVSTSVVVPANTPFRVRVNGTVTVSKNPVAQTLFPSLTNANFSKVGSYGAGGSGSNELMVMLVGVKAGGQTYPINFTGLQSGSSAPDSAVSNIKIYPYDLTIYVGRTGVAGAVGQGTTHADLYLLSSAQTLTVEKLTDLVHLTATPSYVHANAQVTFLATRDDGSTGVDSWHWQPDASQSWSTNTPCWWNNPCLFNVAASGTMTVYTSLGYANAHVTVYSNFTLTSDKSLANFGDTVTFTPKYDGVAGPAARWRWVPSDTSGDHTACANGVSPCKKGMHGSGTMWAYTATSGGDSASAQVTVRDKFELRAAPSLIAAGAVVTFRPYLNGQPTPAARWRWIPQGPGALWDNVAGCAAGATECHRATFVSGVMWASRSSSGGDSASALVTVSTDCGSAFAKRPSRQFANPGRAIVRPTEGRGGAASHAFTATAAACNDSATTSSDAGTDSLPTVPLHVVVETQGIDALPSAGNSTWPIGTVVPFQFLPKAGYDSAVVFVDDTLKKSGGMLARSGTLVMSVEHTIRVATDTNFALRPGMLGLQQRLRALINASDKPLAFARYLTWALDTTANPQIDEDLAIAEYLEFDPVADSANLARFDDALANYGFQIDVSGSQQHIVSILSPTDSISPVVADRARGRKTANGPARTSASTTSSNGVAFIYVNGIRTVESGAFASKRNLALLLNPASFPNSTVNYYWNRNSRGEIAAFGDQHLGCAGRALRDGTFRTALVALARYDACKVLAGAALVTFDDLAESMNQFVRLQWGIPITTASADADRLARIMAYYHQHAFQTVMVTHSQGNMVYADATTVLPSLEGGPVNTTSCTAGMSLASPINKSSFSVSGIFLDGMDINGDILTLIPLPNDFTPWLNSQAALDGQAAEAAAPVWLRPIIQDFWGPRIHDVDRNYFQGLLASTTTSRIRTLYNLCLSR